MAYIGQSPAPKALVASDITDGIISNAKLAQDIISADTALGATPADTDELLVSDAGVLKRMDYSYIKAGSSDFVKLATYTASDDATLEIVCSPSKFSCSLNVISDNTPSVSPVSGTVMNKPLPISTSSQDWLPVDIVSSTRQPG